MYDLLEKKRELNVLEQVYILPYRLGGRRTKDNRQHQKARDLLCAGDHDLKKAASVSVFDDFQKHFKFHDWTYDFCE